MVVARPSLALARRFAPNPIGQGVGGRAVLHDPPNMVCVAARVNAGRDVRRRERSEPNAHESGQGGHARTWRSDGVAAPSAHGNTSSSNTHPARIAGPVPSQVREAMNDTAERNADFVAAARQTDLTPSQIDTVHACAEQMKCAPLPSSLRRLPSLHRAPSTALLVSYATMP